MYSDEDMGQAYKEGYEKGKADGGYAVLSEIIADIETASEPIQNALYATGRFTTEQCDDLADGILQYIKDAGLFIGKK